MPSNRSILDLHVNDLDEMRLRILAAIVFGSLLDERRESGLRCAASLQELSRMMEHAGDTALYPPIEDACELLADQIKGFTR